MLKLATIQRIHSITPHPDAEVTRIELGRINAWPVVIPKNKFKNDDLVVFIENDCILPEIPEFEFLRKQHFRTWNARFRGQVSSGLVCSMDILPQNIYNENDDVTDILNIKKWERPIDIQMNGDTKGNFPSNLISITDELNLYSYPRALEELKGKRVYITQKNDGSSTSFIFNNAEFKACSRRLELKENSGFPWEIANKYNIKEKLSNFGGNIAIQGEAIGPKLNGNRMALKDIQFRLFRAKNLDAREIFNFNQLKELSEKLSLPMVKIIDEFDFDDSIHTVEYFRNLADSQMYDNGKPGEGIVIAPISPFYSSILGKDWSVKVINSNYKQE